MSRCAALQVAGVPEDELQREDQQGAAQGRFAFGMGADFGQPGAAAAPADHRCGVAVTDIHACILWYLPYQAVMVLLCAMMNSSISDTSCLKAARPCELTYAIQTERTRDDIATCRAACCMCHLKEHAAAS